VTPDKHKITGTIAGTRIGTHRRRCRRLEKKEHKTEPTAATEIMHIHDVRDDNKLHCGSQSAQMLLQPLLKLLAT